MDKIKRNNIMLRPFAKEINDINLKLQHITMMGSNKTHGGKKYKSKHKKKRKTRKLN